jgi:hypothetical protein
MAAGSFVNVRYEQRKIPAPISPDVPARLVRLGPGGRRVAFVRDDDEPGIYVGDAFDPLSVRRLVPIAPYRVEDLRFSPDGAHLAYRLLPLLGAASTVGIAAANNPGELRRVNGTGFSWTPGGKALLVADPERRALVRHSLEDGSERELGRLEDDGDPGFPSRIAVAPDGNSIAYTAGRESEDISEVWLVRREPGATTTQLLTELPGASVHVLPFWSPRGATLGLFCVHEGQGKSALIVVPRLEGEGEVLYESNLLDPPVTPVFAPGGRHIVFFRTEGPGDDMHEGPTRLTLLDARRETFRALAEVDELSGSLSFQDERTLLVDGGAAAHLLTFDDPI